MEGPSSLTSGFLQLPIVFSPRKCTLCVSPRLSIKTERFLYSAPPPHPQHFKECKLQCMRVFHSLTLCCRLFHPTVTFRRSFSAQINSTLFIPEGAMLSCHENLVHPLFNNSYCRVKIQAGEGGGGGVMIECYCLL